ncbi:MAG: dipeptidase [Rhodothermales bacterium]
MTDIPASRILDGHNDTLLRLILGRKNELGGEDRSFFTRSALGHIDLPRAREGGLGGGFFAVYIPPPLNKRTGGGRIATANGYEIPPIAPIETDYAYQVAHEFIEELNAIDAASEGQVQVVRTVETLTTCLRDEVLAAILHFEGAEPLDADLKALPEFYDAGLRSLGITWSRPNAFGHGVPFRYPHSPDTGPGLTDAGQALVKACNQLGIMLDLAHLNERGFWDVANRSDAPLVVTHAGAHTLCPSSRNLTDQQLDAIQASGGVVGVTFAVYDLRADGREEPDTPITEIVRHVRYIADRIGIEHVALGSDFDGTLIPKPLGDAAGLPQLVQALRDAGFDDDALRQVTHANWLRVLDATWK